MKTTTSKSSICNGNLRVNCLSLPLMTSHHELIKWVNEDAEIGAEEEEIVLAEGNNNLQLHRSFNSTETIGATTTSSPCWLLCCYMGKGNSSNYWSSWAQQSSRSCESNNNCVMPIASLNLSLSQLTHNQIAPSSSTTLEDGMYATITGDQNNNKLFVSGQNNNNQNYLKKTSNFKLK